MADCKTCIYYSEEQDKFRMEYNDVAVVGENTDEQHFCMLFSPIKQGVFNGSEQCPEYINDTE